MEFRSTNDNYSHHQGDIITNVSSGGVANSSHGVHMTGGSTGGIVTAAGDEDNVALNVTGKGTGPTVIGNSSSPVRIAESTGSLTRAEVSLVQFTIPALTTSGIAPVESTVTFAGVTTNAVYLVSQRATYNSTSVSAIHITARPSTGGLRLTYFNHGASSLSGSTASAYVFRAGF